MIWDKSNRNSLLNKIAILEGDKQGIKNEILENEKDLQDIVTIVEKQGSMADADKLKVHVKEVESVTRLRTVLLVREETAQQKIKVTMDAKDKVTYRINVEIAPTPQRKTIISILSKPSVQTNRNNSAKKEFIRNE